MAILTVRDLIKKLNDVVKRHGDTYLIGVIDADTSWEIPVEEFTFDEATKRVLLRGEYHGEEWPDEKEIKSG